MATATPVQSETLKTLPSDAARQVQWGFADRYELQMLMPALQKAKPAPLAQNVSYASVAPPKQQRQTRVVKDHSADEIAAELAEWITHG